MEGQSASLRPNGYPRDHRGPRRSQYSYDQSKNNARFGPQIRQTTKTVKTLQRTEDNFPKLLSPSEVFCGDRFGGSSTRVVPRPDHSLLAGGDASKLTKLKEASLNFQKNLSLSAKTFVQPTDLVKNVKQTYASISAVNKDILKDKINVKNISTRTSVMPNVEESSQEMVQSQLWEQPTQPPEDATGDQPASGAGGDAGHVSRDIDTLQGFNSNTFAKDYSHEAWVQYSGLIQNHIFKIESCIRAKAETLEKTLLLKMTNGSSPGGSPLSFQASCSGSISARTWKDKNGRLVNLIPGKDFTVQPQVIPGIAEIFVNKEEHRDWLTNQYRFPYLKLSIDTDGSVVEHGQAGSFYITQLRAPLQIYDFWGLDHEHFDTFDDQIVGLMKDLAPGLGFNVVNVEGMVPMFDPQEKMFKTTPVLANKRVTVEVPVGDPFVLTDGSFLLNLPAVGERVVHSSRVKAMPECLYCGKQCFKDGCRERCKHCGMAFVGGHSEETCPHKSKGEDFAKANLWIEKSTKQALKFHTNIVSYKQTAEQKRETLKNRTNVDEIMSCVLETQLRIQSTTMVPAAMRDAFEDVAVDRRDFLVPADSSSVRKNSARARDQQRGSDAHASVHTVAQPGDKNDEDYIKRLMKEVRPEQPSASRDGALQVQPEQPGTPVDNVVREAAELDRRLESLPVHIQPVNPTEQEHAEAVDGERDLDTAGTDTVEDTEAAAEANPGDDSEPKVDTDSTVPEVESSSGDESSDEEEVLSNGEAESPEPESGVSSDGVKGDAVEPLVVSNTVPVVESEGDTSKKVESLVGSNSGGGSEESVRDGGSNPTVTVTTDPSVTSSGLGSPDTSGGSRLPNKDNINIGVFDVSTFAGTGIAAAGSTPANSEMEWCDVGAQPVQPVHRAKSKTRRSSDSDELTAKKGRQRSRSKKKEIKMGKDSFETYLNTLPEPRRSEVLELQLRASSQPLPDTSDNDLYS